MKLNAIVVFDSYFGNTEKIGRAIAVGIPDIVVRRASYMTPSDLKGFDVIIIGSPTQGFRPTQNIIDLLKGTKARDMNGVKIATFDTRLDLESINSKVMRTVINFGGYAAPVIQKILFKKGAKPVVPPEGFLVSGHEGPPVEGELERATEWGRRIADICQELTMSR
jgi:flavodoxin